MKLSGGSGPQNPRGFPLDHGWRLFSRVSRGCCPSVSVKLFALPSRFVRGPSQSRFLSLNSLFHHAIMHRDPEVWFSLCLIHIIRSFRLPAVAGQYGCHKDGFSPYHPVKDTYSHRDNTQGLPRSHNRIPTMQSRIPTLP